MCEKELDNPALFKNEARIKRLCLGSGLPYHIVMSVIDEQRNWEGMIKNLDPQLLRFITMKEKPSFSSERQFREYLQKMAKAMGPKMLRNLGGIGGLEASLRQSWKGGNAKVV